MQEEEDQLHGGNSADVVRVGATVRRATGPWSPGVHALLRYLEAQGFGAAPAFLGLDGRSREMLTFIAGETGNYPLAPYMWTDKVLVEVAQLIRYYHDATVGFVAPESAQWQIVYPDASKHEVMCHNDLAPYNMVYMDEMPRALIDFDNAGPGPRAWDLAHAAYRFVPLMHLEDAETARTGLHTISQQGRRLRIFCDAYGIPAQAVLEMVEPRLRTLCTTLVERAAAGEGAFQKMLADGHLEYYERELTAFQKQHAKLEIQIR